MWVVLTPIYKTIKEKLLYTILYRLYKTLYNITIQYITIYKVFTFNQLVFLFIGLEYVNGGKWAKIRAGLNCKI